ncbi:MAG: site-2 protease family protein [candidate division NC10 bacterium]|nr:site-2 protease family protein [candidate division NC10 bacterium]
MSDPDASQGSAFELARLLADVFLVEELQVQEAAVRFRGVLLASPETAVRVLTGRLAPLGYHPLLRSREEIVLLRAAPRRGRPWLAEPWPNLLLFVATLLTTLFVGALHQGADPLSDPRTLAAGLPFAATLLAILGVHELGHYFTAKAYGIRVTLPYFIPAPIGLGTFGAFIRMKSPVTDRRALLDVGIAGPLAGLVLAIPAVLVGLRLSTVVPAQGAGLGLGSSLLFLLLQAIAVGPIPDGLDILLHPVAFAGWIGLFVTALNLLPIGQLDGGHIAYALLGRRHRQVAMGTAALLVALGIFFWQGWLVWAVLAMAMGFQHPPPLDDVTPLDARRRLLALGAFALLLLLITPAPFFFPEGM